MPVVALDARGRCLHTVFGGTDISTVSARRWALIECTCGKGFGTEEGLEAHLRQERGHGVATTMPGNGPRQGADSRLINTLVSTYAAPASLAAASQALPNSAQAPLTLL